MSAERQRYLLYGLLVVLAVVVVRQYLAASSATTAAVVAARRAASAAVPPPPADVGLAALEEARPGPADGGRNPFVFGARQAAVAEGGPRRPRPSADAGLPPPVLPPAGPPPLPPIPFKFIGLVEGTTSAKKIAVLSDSKGLVVHGTEGTIIDGRYRILAIGTESIDIAYADGRGRQTLRLSGQ
ncbi:MAG: hypothetical protein R2745_03370 [Vicinamibacterales bacterium]